MDRPTAPHGRPEPGDHPAVPFPGPGPGPAPGRIPGSVPGLGPLPDPASGTRRPVPAPGSGRLPGLLDLVELDLRERPFTDRGSRLLVLAQDDGALWITRAAYEQSLARTCVLRDLRLYGATGTPLRLRSARPDRVAFEDDTHLVFTGPETLIATGPPGVRATWTTPDGVRHDTRAGSGHLPVVGTAPASAGRADGLAALRTARARWTSWSDRMPPVRPGLRPAAALAWWTMAVNLVPIAAAGGREGLVPSKLGYLGVWNWDACFHAVALRHADPGLARDQVRILLDQQLPDGQLPDVVHDTGVLTSTTDLPRSDVARLAQHVGRAGLDPSAGEWPDTRSAPVPVTKPPLTAWAVWKIHEADPDPGFLAEVYPALVRAHTWWLAACDPDGDGLAEYLHPYSSGLDDSPVWDHGPCAEPPDLNAYLVHQADRLADIASVVGLPADAAAWRARAAAHTDLLVNRRWTGERFTTLVGGRPVEVGTPLGLLPLFTGRLPRPVADRLVADLGSSRFDGAYGIPSVAFGDPAFDPEEMWRGPVWMNINYLLIDGLRRSGHPVEADRLTERCLAAVAAAGGMPEYWNPLTGRRAYQATTGFGWTAALFLDLARV